MAKAGRIVEELAKIPGYSPLANHRLFVNKAKIWGIKAQENYRLPKNLGYVPVVLQIK